MGGAGFDRIARAYRWLEYLSFGRALERCRLAQPAAMRSARRALVLGDGDGRFTARLLACNPSVQVVAIDSSAAMLALLQARVRRGGTEARLIAITGDTVALLAHPSSLSREWPRALEVAALRSAECFDLVVSHFFLDCLSTAQAEKLARGVRARLAPEATWIVSEFTNEQRWARWIVRALYLGFRLLAGLRVQQLPDYEAALTREGFTRIRETRMLRGLLVSSLWAWHAEVKGPEGGEATALPDATSHSAS